MFWHLRPHLSLLSLTLSLTRYPSTSGLLQSARPTREKQILPGRGVRDEREVDEMENIKRNKHFFMIVRAKVNSEED